MNHPRFEADLAKSVSTCQKGDEEGGGGGAGAVVEQPETHGGPAAARLLRSAAPPPPVELAANQHPTEFSVGLVRLTILIACEEGREYPRWAPLF